MARIRPGERVRVEAEGAGGDGVHREPAEQVLQVDDPVLVRASNPGLEDVDQLLGRRVHEQLHGLHLARGEDGRENRSGGKFKGLVKLYSENIDGPFEVWFSQSRRKYFIRMRPNFLL